MFPDEQYDVSTKPDVEDEVFSTVLAGIKDARCCLPMLEQNWIVVPTEFHHQQLGRVFLGIRRG